MRASASLQSHESIWSALETAARDAMSRLGTEPEWAVVFVSDPEAEKNAEEVLQRLRALLPTAKFLGGMCDALIGTRTESDEGCSVSLLLLAELGGEARTLVLEYADTPDGPSVLGLDDELHRDAKACGGMLVLACPESFSAERLFDSLESAAPEGETPPLVFGGNVFHSPWTSPAQLFCEDRVLHSGAIGWILPATVRWSILVSQGCRPIGEPMVITGMQDQSIATLGGKPALDRLRDMFQQLPNREREMAMRLLLVGRAISEYSETFSHGEFLIRNILKIDQESRTIRVSDRMKIGQTVRFHLLDAEAADADLRYLMARAQQSDMHPKAGLLFSCNGRGKRMFDVPAQFPIPN
jgi:small ligand-binding sensory domain FIST